MNSSIKSLLGGELFLIIQDKDGRYSFHYNDLKRSVRKQKIKRIYEQIRKIY